MTVRVRVLKIPVGAKVDADGRGIGTDWQLASFGADGDGTRWYLTADGMRASELADAGEALEPGTLAKLLCELLNNEVPNAD